MLMLACATEPDPALRRSHPPRDRPGADETVADTADIDADPDADPDADTDTDADADTDAEPACAERPTSDAPADQSCSSMDWHLDPVGYYKISTFGTSNDSTTWGGRTSCGWLQEHYDYWECRQDANTGDCLDDDWHIPWVHGSVDYDYDAVLAAVDAYAPADVPEPAYFYVAGAQRFGCGAVLRVSYGGRCVVVYAEDGGPNSLYEGEGYGERRILDSSPAVVAFLQVQHTGWVNSDLVYVEWAEDGDVPGEACTPCYGAATAEGSESRRTPYDVEHLGLDCR
jgi:hypothetical protein